MIREIKFTEKALKDLYELDYTIRYNYQAPLTAERYLTGLKQTIHERKETAFERALFVFNFGGKCEIQHFLFAYVKKL